MILRAAQCGLSMQHTLTRFAAAAWPGISLRIGVAAGDLVLAQLGGAGGQWELVALGSSVLQSIQAEQQARPGQVVLAPDALAEVGELCAGRVLPTGALHVHSVASPLPRPAHDAPELVGVAGQAALQAYMPKVIRDRVVMGHTEWVAELRHSTTMFVLLPDLDPIARLDQAQAAIHTVQATLAHFEGQLMRLGVDEKGLVLLAGFGLPPLAHEDDAARAVEAALALQAELHAAGLRLACGVTTGRVFAGTFGNERRCEYTILGDDVNLANRLMHAAGDSVLCDATTYKRAQTRFSFKPQVPIRAKGKARPVPVYRPLGPAQQSHPAPATLVGRIAERASLIEHLRRLQESDSGGVVIVEGEAGIGKSRLILELQAQGRALGLRCLAGTGNAIEISTPYHAWGAIFEQILRLDALVPDAELRRAHVLAHLAALPERAESGGALQADMRGHAPLLGTVLGLKWPDSETTRHLSSESRADNTRELLVQILQAATQSAPLVVVLEDAHWLDSASWALLRLVGWRVERLLLVIATRPLPDPAPAEYAELLQAAHTQRLTLGALAEDDIGELLRRRLQVNTVPEPVSALVFKRAEGHPFFSEELVYALRDAGLIEVDSGVCRLTVREDELESLDLPSTVEGVITSRIDRLTPAQQLTLKVASVIGRVFPVRTLQAIHPMPENSTPLLDDLDTLMRLNLTPLESPEPNLSYTFKHSITLEVTYNLLLYAQRRRLHRALAEWYEEAHAQDLSSVYPLMAYHWSRAIEDARAEPELASRAIAILDKAAAQAIRSDANQEVVQFLRELIRLDDERALVSADPDTSLQRARWERQLGEAHFRLGNAPDARRHLERALALLGQPVATNQGALLVSTLAQLGRQVVRRALLPSAQAPTRQHARLVEAARAYEMDALIAYISEESLATINGNLYGMNLAELAGPSPGLAVSYAMVGLIAGVSALHGPARFYFKRALITGNAVDDPSCLGRVWYNRALYAAGRTAWREAALAQSQSQAIFERYGDQRWRETSLLTRGILFLLRADLGAAATQFEEMVTAGRRRGDVQIQAWSLAGLAAAYLLLGRTTEAMQCLDIFESHAGIRQGLLTDAGTVHNVQATRLLLQARRGDSAAALPLAAGTLREMEQHASAIYYRVFGYRALNEAIVLLAESEAGREPGEHAQLVTLAKRAHALVRRFARVLPIGKPELWLSAANYAWLTGDGERAFSAWRKGLEAARRNGMPLEEGTAHFQIGRRLPPTTAARRAHLERALAIFQRCGAGHDAARTEEALAIATGAPSARPPR